MSSRREGESGRARRVWTVNPKSEPRETVRGGRDLRGTHRVQAHATHRGGRVAASRAAEETAGHAGLAPSVAGRRGERAVRRAVPRFKLALGTSVYDDRCYWRSESTIVLTTTTRGATATASARRAAALAGDAPRRASAYDRDVSRTLLRATHAGLRRGNHGANTEANRAWRCRRTRR